MSEFELLKTIYEHLQDDESRELMSIMLRKAVSESPMEYLPRLSAYCKNPTIETRLSEKISKYKGIIIYGSGLDGRASNIALRRCGYSIECFCDSYKAGVEIDGVKVIDVNDAIVSYPDHLICVCSRKYGLDMYKNLLAKGVSEERIYVSAYSVIIGSNSGAQYFDVLKPPTGGVIIDGGAYDGDTALQMMNWVGNKYDKILCFEAEPKQAEALDRRIKQSGWENVQVIGKGLWNQSKVINFKSSNAGSTITSDGDTSITCCALDEEVSEKVSFIKMDIEGAELKALQGATGIIKRDKPGMAICIYHKRADILDIASYIISLIPECKMWIRHYTTYRWETVLYVE